MKRFTNAEITEIRANLNNGVRYCGIRNGYGVGEIAVSYDGQYIIWKNAGQSANKNTDSELRWLLETIFGECETVTPAEYSEYHVNYIPIDKQYKGIDLSSKHPNVFGL
jgi:hypothetical protein